MKSKYQPVTVPIVEKLKRIVGKENIIFEDEDKLSSYSHDELVDKSYASMPEVVVKPDSARQISAIIKMANKEKIPVTPRGAGSGLSGGAVPVLGGILLSTERMNSIIEIDTNNLFAVLEPGVITNEFNKEVEKEGLFFAGYPMSMEMCYIGGNVAENAGGGRAVKYGVTGRYIMGLEVVLPNGEIATFGGKRVKDVTGYNMVQLMVGSEGTLGIFTKIYVKLLPLPKAKIDMMALFKNIETAINMIPLIMIEKRILPTGIEFMDKLSVDTSCRYLGEAGKYDNVGSVLIIEMDGTNQNLLREECLDVGELCLDNGAIDVFVAETPKEQKKIWSIRQHVAEAFKAISPEQSLEDIVVPINAIPQLIDKVQEISKKHGVLIPCYGHAGDGNIHATVVKRPEDSLEHWRELLPTVLQDLYKVASELGGTISGEHGIGHKRKKFLSIVLKEVEIEAMKSIKRALDPNNILNPGKIFD